MRDRGGGPDLRSPALRPAPGTGRPPLARRLAAAALASTLGGCNPADLSIYFSARAIKSGLLETCGGVPGCREAVHAQFDECFAKSGYERLKQPGAHTVDPEAAETLINEAVERTYLCIVDDEGRPYFSAQEPAAGESS